MNISFMLILIIGDLRANLWTLQYINGVDHLLAEYEIYTNLVLPIHHAIRNLPRKAKIPPSALPGAVFLQAIGSSSD